MNADRPDWTPTATVSDRTCRNCDAAVTEQFARVFGSNRNIAFHCRECVALRDLSEGAATQPEWDPAEDRGQRSSDNHPIFFDVEGDR